MTNVRDTKRPATATAERLPARSGSGRPRRFHEASSPFNVARELRVACVARRKGPGSGPLRPGEVVQVSVTTTNPQGNPVSAELSLAMVEQALLDRFPDRLPPIQDYFQAQRRESAVRTVSSITFTYNPTTQPINPRLLAEEDRAAVAAEEDLSRRLAIGRSPVTTTAEARTSAARGPSHRERRPDLNVLRENGAKAEWAGQDPFATGAEEGDNEVHEEIDEGRAARQRVARGPGGMAGFAPMGPVADPASAKVLRHRRPAMGDRLSDPGDRNRQERAGRARRVPARAIHPMAAALEGHHRRYAGRQGGRFAGREEEPVWRTKAAVEFHRRRPGQRDRLGP